MKQSDLFPAVGGTGRFSDAEPEITIEVPVLIVGGGPSGLLLAYLLSRLKVRTFVAEKYPLRLAAPKAHALSPRSLEICRQFGIDTAALRRIGTPRDNAKWVRFCDTLGGEEIGRLPYERMDIDVLQSTPEMIHNIPQPAFESYIVGLLANDQNTTVQKGLEFTSCKQDDEGVMSLLYERSTGRKWAVRSRHVVACDGAKSTVRSSLGIVSDGEDSFETMMTIHFRADLTQVLGDRVGMLFWMFDPAASGFVIGYDLHGELVLITNFDSTRWPVEKWTEQHAHDVVMATIGRQVPIEVLSFRPWVLSRKVAKRYQDGGVFLAGDAAHSFPPTGGLGLNCGIADVHNLAFKLAAVHKGQAGAEVLETYDAERRPIADIYSRQSAENGKKIFSFLKKLGTAGIEDETIARENLHAAMHDPSKQAEIAEGIEDQREHFDNLELHIGYVYGSKEMPPHASHYVPKFRPGARLPHAFIRPKVALRVPKLDLSYISELDMADNEALEYSTLDLCAPDAFTLFVGSTATKSEQDRRWPIEKPAQIVIDKYVAGRDFLFAAPPPEEWTTVLANGGGLLVRPDQHILSVLEAGMSAEEVEEKVLAFLRMAV